jgi:hypothetical protein
VEKDLLARFFLKFFGLTRVLTGQLFFRNHRFAFRTIYPHALIHRIFPSAVNNNVRGFNRVAEPGLSEAEGFKSFPVCEFLVPAQSVLASISLNYGMTSAFPEFRKRGMLRDNGKKTRKQHLALTNSRV